ncbi:hypothetical protein LshimejAT787_0801410 [Lyophyllum shimeji]|uniref:Uncharacterized protein n=1 Tax=Lyophyllum shimeji TaxID=47721 RepID=A0A9P3UQK2_LYOSH|nr:hypothetical protein LshimejAT787_0801410 [Lyophyllum shimeji]
MSFFTLLSRFRTKSPSPRPAYIKCNISSCKFRNPRQVAPGQYTCKGLRSSGRPCKGVFYVSQSVANDAMHDQARTIWRSNVDDRAARLKAEQEEERKRSEALRYQLEEDGRRLAAAQLAARLETDQSRAPSHSEGHRSPEPNTRHLPLERRPAQRRRNGVDNAPHGSHTRYPCLTVAPQFHASHYYQKPLPPQPQEPSHAPPPAPIQYYPNPQPHIRGLPIPPESCHRARPPRPPRRDLEYRHAGRF